MRGEEMSDVNYIITRLQQVKIVPVIVIDQAEDIIPLGSALADNGLSVAEITFRTACAENAIKLLREARSDMIVGAGTIVNRTQVCQSKTASAHFIVSPGLNSNTVKACQEMNIPVIPGVNNPSTIEQALEMDIDFVKFFPAEPSGGIKMLKSLLAPYQKLRVMPTGGIGMHNLLDYLVIPQVVACGGSWMVPEQLIRDKNWQEIGRLAREVSDFIK